MKKQSGKQKRKKPKINLRKKRYRIIANIYGSSKLAGQLSGWSNEHILRVYGIDINSYKQNTPKLIKQSKRLRKEKQRELVSFFKLRKITDSIEAFNFRKKPKKIFGGEKIDYLKQTEEDKILSRAKRYPFKTKREEWVLWSKHRPQHPEETFPRMILNLIHKINLDHDLDIEDSYGFAVVNKVYVLGWSFEEAYDFIELKKGSFKGYIYTTEELY